MHFKTPKINLNIQPLERFLEAMPRDPIDRRGSCSLEVTRATVPQSRTTAVLEHAR
jgi:hypothetical protein